jgi:amidase
VRSPLAGVRLDRELRASVLAIGDLLLRAGHRVAEADPPYRLKYANAIVAWWCAAVAEEAEALDRRRLERRTRGHAAVGRIARRLGLVRESDRESWRRASAQFFTGYDLLVTPALATAPIGVGPWSRRGWLANVLANARFAPFAAPWNFSGYPAAVLPCGMHSSGLPVGVQLVTGPGNEVLLLSVARQIETLKPFARHAPLAGTS